MAGLVRPKSYPVRAIGDDKQDAGIIYNQRRFAHHGGLVSGARYPGEDSGFRSMAPIGDVKNPARESRWDLFSRVTPAMREFVLGQTACRRFLAAVVPMLHVLLECDDDVRVGFGCSAGRHRSAILVEEIARRMERDDVTIKVVHREEGGP